MYPQIIHACFYKLILYLKYTNAVLKEFETKESFNV